MLVQSSTCVHSEALSVWCFLKGNWQSPAVTACRVSCSSARLDSLSHKPCVVALRKMSSQIEEKMSSNVAVEECVGGLPRSTSYEIAMEVLSSLITRQKRGDKSSVGGTYGKLERMEMYLKILGLEEQIAGLRIIHVAGTKGKGSTCAFCEAILRECGLRTGLFTSPHLIDVRERFRIDGLDISEEKFLQYFWDCWDQLSKKVTEDLPMPPLFQFLTVMMFKIFVCEKVDVGIIEVGLGGRQDSTNVIKKPVVCGIASLGMDHMETLGDTLGEIAAHKAGILKPNIPAFTVPQLPEAMVVLEEQAEQLLVPLEVVPPLSCQKLNGLKLSLAGDHQFVNAGLAVALCKSCLQCTGIWEKMSPNDIHEVDLPAAFLRGLSSARLSGRAEIVFDAAVKAHSMFAGDLIFYLDGAHSPESMDVCAKWFSSSVIGNNDSTSASSLSSSLVDGCIEVPQKNDCIHDKEGNVESGKITKQVLLFNCMEVRNPEILLPRLVGTCASSGVHFSKALFVPSMSTYNKVISGASVSSFSISKKDLSWQLSMQRIWEKLFHGADFIPDKGIKTLPPHEFICKDYPQCNPGDGNHSCSAVIPSLPLAIKWLRDCVKENPSFKVQVLVTGSLHLVGDVLKLLRR